MAQPQLLTGVPADQQVIQGGGYVKKQTAAPNYNTYTPVDQGGGSQVSGSYNPASPYQGQNPYDQLRKQAVDTTQAASQGAMDALARRQAALGDGNMNSGSYIKGVEDINRSTQANTQNALGNINMGELQMSNQLGEAQKQRDVQQAEFGSQLGQQASQFAQELPLKQRQLDLEANQQAMDAHANDLNYQLGQYQSEHSGGLFGGGGALGLGGGSGGLGSAVQSFVSPISKLF